MLLLIDGGGSGDGDGDGAVAMANISGSKYPKKNKCDAFLELKPNNLAQLGEKLLCVYVVDVLYTMCAFATVRTKRKLK